VALLWLVGMTTFALTVPPVSIDFRIHLLTGLAMFCVIIVGPLLLVLVTMNWIVRRVAGSIIILLFFGMARGGLSGGAGLGAGTGILVVCALLVGSMLFFLSRPVVMIAVADAYNFLSIRDVLSGYTFRRKPMPPNSAVP